MPLPLRLVCVVLLLPAVAAAAPVVRAADIEVSFATPTSCAVTMALTIDGAEEIEHRVEAFDDDRITLESTRAANLVGDVNAIGQTRSLTLRPQGGSYDISYRAQLADARAYRCPLWLPTIPADGQSRSVRIRVDLPPGSNVGGSMPMFDWTSTQGTTTLGHIPAFIRVPYSTASEAAPWDISRVMDAVAVGMFAVASAWWVWRRRR